MKKPLKDRIEKAIDDVLEDSSEKLEDMWRYFPHNHIAKQMAEAAALVFDSCQDGQKFFIEEIEGHK